MLNPKLLAYRTSDDNSIRLTAEGFMGNTEMIIPISMELFKVCYERYVSGYTIQRAFPMLSKVHREFMMTGMTEQEQEQFFDSVA